MSDNTQQEQWTDDKIRQRLGHPQFISTMSGTYVDCRVAMKLALLIIDGYSAALAARDERIKELEAQLAEAQRWQPITDNDVTRGFAAMLAFNGLRDYADCRVCRQADAAQEERGVG